MRLLSRVLWAFSVALLILSFLRPALIWVGAVLLALASTSTVLPVLVYRPPEDHLGVLYRCDRFWRLLEPNQWIVCIPGIDRVRTSVSLHLCHTSVEFVNLFTKDRVPIDCEFLVYYQIDLRCASPLFVPQALNLREQGWHSRIRSALREIADRIVGGRTLEELLSPAGRLEMKRTLIIELAAQVRDLGLRISPRTGVSIQLVKPADTVWQAMVDRFVAALLGEAALVRLQPVLEELARQQPGAAWDTLILEWAAAVAQQGSVPDVVLTGDSLRQNSQMQLALPARVWSALQDLIMSSKNCNIDARADRHSKIAEGRPT